MMLAGRYLGITEQKLKMLVLSLLGITEQKVQMLITFLPSAFPTSLVAPLYCSFPLSWRQNPYGQFLWAPFSCLLHLPRVANYFKADRPEWCSLVLSNLPCPSSSLFQQLLHSSLLPRGAPLGRVTLLFWTAFPLNSCQGPYDDLQRDLGAWLLKGWFSNQSGAHVV